MKRTIINSLSGIILAMTAFIFLFQGFGFPSIPEWMDIALRVLAAASVQMLCLVNIKNRWLKLLPLFLCAAVALWGGWLYLTSDAWQNVTLGMYAKDYCTPLLGSTLMCIVMKYK